MSKKPKITKTIKIEKPGKPTITREVVKVLPENTSDSEIDRLVEGPDYFESVSNLREYWRSIGSTPCAYRHCFNRLEEDAHPNRKFCSVTCRNKENKAIYDERHPGKRDKAIKKYWRKTKVS